MAAPKKKTTQKAPVKKVSAKKTPAKKAPAKKPIKPVAKTQTKSSGRSNNKKTASNTPQKTTAPQSSAVRVSQVVENYTSAFQTPNTNATYSADQLASCISIKNYAFMEFCESGGESHPTVYKDCKGKPTIAHGVLLTQKGSNYYCKVDGKACCIPSGTSLSAQQQRQLSQFMLKDKVKICQDYIHNYEMLLPSEQFLALDLTYQGAIKGSDFILFEREYDDATAVLAQQQKGNKERCALRYQAALITKKVKELRSANEEIDPQVLSQQICTYLTDPKTKAEVQKAVFGDKKISDDEKKLLQPTDLALALACQTSYCACGQIPPNIDRSTLISAHQGRKTPLSDDVFNASINGKVPTLMVQCQGLDGKVPAQTVEMIKALDQKANSLVKNKKNATISTELWEGHKKLPHIELYTGEPSGEIEFLADNETSRPGSLKNTLAQAQEKRPDSSNTMQRDTSQTYG